MSVHELVNIIIRANTKYARLLEKDIQFVYKIDGVHPHYHIYTILSIINNIVTNAVEAIQGMGTITIDINKDHHFVEFQIGDNGMVFLQNIKIQFLSLGLLLNMMI